MSTRLSPAPSRCGGTARASLSPSSCQPWCFLLTSSSVDQLIALDAFLGIELDDRSHEHSLLVRAAGIDGERFTELHRTLALVDVSVQGQEGLVLLNRLAHRGRTDRPKRTATVEKLEVGVDCRRLVKAGLIGRAVQVEDGVRRILDLLRHRLDAFAELLLGLLAVRGS